MLFAEINAHLADQGMQVSGGTIVDAPSPTKSQRGERGPEMHQMKKGSQWYCGMKPHFGGDSRTKLIHAVVVTAANTADGRVVDDFVRAEETGIRGNKAYDSRRETISAPAPPAQNHTHGHESPASPAEPPLGSR